MVIDVIGDFIIRLKNGGLVKKSSVEVPYSKFKHEMANKLVETGHIKKVDVQGEIPNKVLNVSLSYKNGKHLIRGVARVSKPSHRRYIGVRDINSLSRGELFLLSTPKGILTGTEAIQKRVGGEVLCKIW